MIWRLSLAAWVLWGIALLVWLLFGGGYVIGEWQALFVLWVLNGGLLWLIMRDKR